MQSRLLSDTAYPKPPAPPSTLPGAPSLPLVTTASYPCQDNLPRGGLVVPTSEFVLEATSFLKDKINTLNMFEANLKAKNQINNSDNKNYHIKPETENKLSYDDFVKHYCQDTDTHQIVERLAKYRQYLDHLEGLEPAIDVVSILSSSSRECSPEVEIMDVQPNVCTPMIRGEYVDMDTLFNTQTRTVTDEVIVVPEPEDGQDLQFISMTSQPTKPNAVNSYASFGTIHNSQACDIM